MERQYRLLVSITVVLILLAAACHAGAKTIYVKWDSPGPVFNGTTWDTAFHTVGEALATSVANDQIRVAAGNYNERFTLKSSVGLYGGYAGQGELRDPAAYLTVLDGTGSSVSIVTIPSGAPAATVIDGFAIRKCNGAYGAVRSESASPTISNNAFTGSYIGIYLNSGAPAISGNTFSGNDTAIQSNYASPVVTGNSITGNGRNGIVSNGGSPVVRGNLISGNGSASSGAGIKCDGSAAIEGNRIIGNRTLGIDMKNGYSSRIVGNIIAGNLENGIYLMLSRPAITNNTIVGNASYGIYCLSTTATIGNNIIAWSRCGISDTAGRSICSNNAYCGNITDRTGLSPAPGDISADPGFASLAYCDFHIQPGSPCRNAGNNSAPDRPDADIDGQARVQDSVVDIGADESDGTEWSATPRVIYVDASASPGGDGTTWGTAYQTIQAAADDVISRTGAEIWVAPGSYQGAASFMPFTHLYGGFAGTETARSQRDSKLNRSVMEAGTAGAHFTVGPLCTVDGFTFRNWSITADSGPSTINGNTILNGGISCSSGAPVVTNNLVLGGTGISCNQSLSTITGNTVAQAKKGISSSSSWYGLISNNKLFANDLGIECGNSDIVQSNVVVGSRLAGISGRGYNPAPTITGNTVVGGSAQGIHCEYSRAVLSNNLVAFNAVGVDQNSSYLVLSHNNVTGNGADYQNVTPDETDISVDPGFVSWEFGNLHITPTSPCRDAGDSAAPGMQGFDMDGQPRNADGVVDIGADESDGTEWPDAGRIIYINASAPLGGDGETWDTAYSTIQDALMDVLANGGAEIWVAAGSYDAPVYLLPFTYLYGGFAGNEGARDRRDPSANSTSLDGKGKDYVVLTSNLSALDGFAVLNGRHGGILSRDTTCLIHDNEISGNGSGVDCALGRATIRGNRIIKNGDGISCERTSDLIEGNFISGNSFGIDSHSAYPVIVRNIIADNPFGVNHYNYFLTLENNIIFGSANSVTCFSGSGKILNNTIVGSRTYAIDLHDSKSSVDVRNNIIAFGEKGIDCRYTQNKPMLSCNDLFGNKTDYLGIVPDSGSISADPLFRGPSVGDYHLLPDSLCIDTGDISVATPNAVDVDGGPRVSGKGIDIGADEYEYIQVQADVQPGDPGNTIRLKPHHMATGALLGNPSFDARSVNLKTIEFGPAKPAEVHDRGHWEDVNGDGLTDLVLHFYCTEIGVSPGDTSIDVYGRLINGDRFTGSATITVVAK